LGQDVENWRKPGGVSGFLLLALGDDGGVQADPEVVGEFVDLGIAVDFDGLFGGIADDEAVVAPLEMFFEFSSCAVVQAFVEVIG
jgi:hypothetical protein